MTKGVRFVYSLLDLRRGRNKPQRFFFESSPEKNRILIKSTKFSTGVEKSVKRHGKRDGEDLKDTKKRLLRQRKANVETEFAVDVETTPKNR